MSEEVRPTVSTQKRFRKTKLSIVTDYVDIDLTRVLSQLRLSSYNKSMKIKKIKVINKSRVAS